MELSTEELATLGNLENLPLAEVPVPLQDYKAQGTYAQGMSIPGDIAPVSSSLSARGYNQERRLTSIDPATPGMDSKGTNALAVYDVAGGGAGGATPSAVWQNQLASITFGIGFGTMGAVQPGTILVGGIVWAAWVIANAGGVGPDNLQVGLGPFGGPMELWFDALVLSGSAFSGTDPTTYLSGITMFPVPFNISGYGPFDGFNYRYLLSSTNMTIQGMGSMLWTT